MMLKEIQQAVLNEINTKIDDITAKIFDAQQDQRYLPLRSQKNKPVPVVFSEIPKIQSEKINSVKAKKIVTLRLKVIFEDKAEADRLNGIYPVLEAIELLLSFNDFGLDIEPLSHESTEDVTLPEDAQQGQVMYFMEFRTAYVMVSTEETAEDLLRIGLEHILKPGDDTADASDVVELQ